MAENISATLFELNKEKPVAHITLNGYNIAAGGVFGSSGAMRSFKLDSGELIDYWMSQTPLRIRDSGGTEAQVRIFAVPAELDSLGFVEFL